jgi:serine-type D-Ala-D-Ala carboxypeptidase (penicillin-binding protein 5/6)
MILARAKGAGAVLLLFLLLCGVFALLPGRASGVTSSTTGTTKAASSTSTTKKTTTTTKAGGTSTTKAGGTTTAKPATTTTTKPATTSTTKPSGVAGPSVKCEAAFLMDAATGRVIYSKNADERRSIASTTKIMTCILAIENLSLDQTVTVSKRAADVGESEMWLEPGEVRTVEELLYGLMVKSGNDAAMALAEAVSGTVEKFAQKMNAKAVELGLKNTHFQNPHGLEASGHYSSARDMATLGRYGMQNAEFRKLVSTKTVNLPWPGHPGGRTFTNYNTLLPKVSWVDGIKTGYTTEAGWCLIGAATKNGVTLISSVMGDVLRDDVDPDTLALFNYGFAKYKEVTLGTKGTKMAEVGVPYHYSVTTPLVTDGTVKRSLFIDDATTTAVQVTQDLTLPAEAGTVLGTVVYLVAGTPVGQVNLVTTQAFAKPTLGVKFAYFWDRFVAWLKQVV